MHKRTAHELADKVRRQLTGIDGVMAVDGVHLNPHAGTDQGWAVRVARRARNGGDVTIIGSERSGYSTTERTGSARNLPVLIREVFLSAPGAAPDAVTPDDDRAAELLRRACSALRDVAEDVGVVAAELATRKDQLPWVVVTLRRGIPDDGAALKVYGPYSSAAEATKALSSVPEAEMAVESPAVFVSVTQLTVPGGVT